MNILGRGWLYFRIGHGTYLSLILSFVQFIIIAYAFFLQKLTLFEGVHLWLFTILFLPAYTIAAILIGLFHKQKQLGIDTDVTVLANPYVYRLQPGKEERLLMPLTLLNIRANKALLAKLDLLTPEMKHEYESYEDMLLKILSGGELK